MNRINSILHLSFRGYRNNRGRPSSRRSEAGERYSGEMTMPESEMFSKNFGVIDSEDNEDLDEFESDFNNVAEYGKMHERELEIKKLKLKNQIVKRKYFKSEDPPMLTWAEKEQIRLLHAKDSEEWTVDRLSESFPANRDVILKVIRSNWTPKSTKIVTNYDEKVKKNWELYNAGKLLVSPELRACLAKFKNRKIEPMDPEEIAKKIVKQKPVFPKPQSTMFSNIIQSYLDAHPELRDDGDDEIIDKSAKQSVKQIAGGETIAEIIDKSAKQSVKQIAGGKTIADNPAVLEVSNTLKKTKISKNESLTFDEFLKRRMEHIEVGKMTAVERVLVDEYKLRKTEAYRDQSLFFTSDSAVASSQKKKDSDKPRSVVFESRSAVHTTDEIKKMEESFEKIMSLDEESKETEIMRGNWSSAGLQKKPDSIGSDQMSKIDRVEEKSQIDEDLMHFDKGSLETGIIVRDKKNDPLDCDYPNYIHIPKRKYKPGVTYRVQDRYYDADGELLYRVIGLKS